MTAAELLTDLQRQGFSLTPLPEGKLAVSPADKLTDTLRAQLRQRKAEVLALLTQPARPLPIESAPAWPCPGCGGPVRLDPPDENLPTRFWTCSRCGTWGATRAEATVPVVWVSNKAVIWPCEFCGQPAEIEEVGPSLDGRRRLTLWNCQPCQTWGVTLNTLREPPAWVSKREQ